MRIAYIAPYKGPTLVGRRPVVKGLSLSNTVKIELIAKLLRGASHDVEIISLGEVVESHLGYYPACDESQPFHPDIPVHYISSLPVRFVNGFWSSFHMLRHFKARHRGCPFDLVIIFNLKRPHITCANYAAGTLGLPVVFEYEDDVFVDVVGQAHKGLIEQYHHRSYINVLSAISGGIAVSPHLLEQMPSKVPKLLLRGVVGDDIATAGDELKNAKRNWVVFSGTHVASNGVAELIESWGMVDLPGWELHITGHGQLTEQLKQLAANKPGITFHGLVSREELVRLLCSARICINPHAVSETPGNVFAFKLIEYLAAGAHCITTPMGALDPALEAGMTYMTDNTPARIAATLREVIASHQYLRLAREAALARCGSAAVTKSLDSLLTAAMAASCRPA
jgi:glycosyltransferase involved in cell wall biosynthesis